MEDAFNGKKREKESKVSPTSERRNNEGKECLVDWVCSYSMRLLWHLDREESPFQRINGTHRKLKVGPLIVHAICAPYGISKWLRKTPFILILGHINTKAKTPRAFSSTFLANGIAFYVVNENCFSFSFHFLHGVGEKGRARQSVAMKEKLLFTHDKRKKGFVRVHWKWYGKVCFATSSLRRLWRCEMKKNCSGFVGNNAINIFKL